MSELSDEEFCEDKECFYGFEGHCGRTEWEYYTHCEKLFWNKKNQRGSPKGKNITPFDRIPLKLKRDVKDNNHG